MNDTIDNNSRSKWLALCLLLLILIAYTITIYIIYTYKVSNDFRGFYYSGKALLAFHNPYLIPVLNKANNTAFLEVTQNISAPLISILTATLSLFLAKDPAYLAWTSVSLICFFISIYLVNKHLLKLRHKSTKYLLTMCLLLSLPFVYGNIFYGQCAMFLLFFLTIGFILANKNKLLTAALCLAIATNIKYFLLFLIVYMVAKKTYKLLSFYLLFTLIIAALPILPNFREILGTYSLVLQTIRWYGANWDASLHGFLVRLLGSNKSYIEGIYHLPSLINWIYYSLGLIYTLLAFFAIKRCQDTNLCLGVALSTMLFISPLAGIYYYIIYYLPFLAALKVCLQRSKRLLLFLFLSLFLACLAPPYLVSQYKDPLVILFIGNIAFFSLFTFTHVNLYLAFTSSSKTSFSLNHYFCYYIGIIVITSYISLYFVSQKFWHPKVHKYPLSYSFEQSTLDKIFSQKGYANRNSNIIDVSGATSMEATALN